MFSEFRFGLERGLVVHLVVGIHVADVVVLDQVHVTKFPTLPNGSCLPRGVTCVNLTNLVKSELIFTIVIITSLK